VYWPWEHFSLLPLFSILSPSLLMVSPWGLYIYQRPLQAPIVPLSKLTNRCPAPQCGREPKASAAGRPLRKKDLETPQASITSASSPAVPRVSCLFACCRCGVEVWCSDNMLLLLMSLLLMGLGCLLGAPTGREVYRMPQSALKGHFTQLLHCLSSMAFIYVKSIDNSSDYRLDSIK